eukprot:Tbor_TRINITY_DN3039_c0_g1::TRINITY_DN3039_c0_g1_i1::g.17306::m.17306/K15175/CDC73; parafibromin
MEIFQPQSSSGMSSIWMALVDEVNLSCGYAADVDIENVDPNRDFFENEAIKESVRKNQNELNVLSGVSDQAANLMKNMLQVYDNDQNQRPTEDFKAFIEENRKLFDEEYYNNLFKFEVDGRSQFYEVPAPLQTRGNRPDDPAISDILRKPDGVPEGVDFFETLMSSTTGHKEPRSAESERLGDYDNEIPGPHTKRGRRLDTSNNHRLSTNSFNSSRSQREKLEENVKQHLALNKTSQLNMMFAQRALELSTTPDMAKVASFHPIILISRLPSAHLQIVNAAKFLHSGIYVPPQSMSIDMVSGSTSRNARPICVTVSPSSAFLKHDRFRSAFRKFDIYDDPMHLSIQDWGRVCCAICTEESWQFSEYFPMNPTLATPSKLFSHICGFLPFFEEDVLPTRLKEWRVKPIQLTRRNLKEGNHIAQANFFWEHLYKYLDCDAKFRDYTKFPVE